MIVTSHAQRRLLNLAIVILWLTKIQVRQMEEPAETRSNDSKQDTVNNFIAHKATYFHNLSLI